MFYLFEADSTLVNLSEISSAQVMYHEADEEFTLNIHMKNGDIIRLYYNFQDEADADLRAIYEKLAY